MADVFISYSRKDKDFVRDLHEALAEHNKDTWVDWEDIPLTAEWREEIYSGIRDSDAFIFVISPDSAASKVCRQELDHAVEHNKRLVPIVRREGDVAFSPDGEYLVSASASIIRTWLWWPEDLINEACTHLTRNLTEKEWQQNVGDDPSYQKTCLNLP